ncbi:MAG: PEP-CTERM sorting domain-containing protein [Planctomycetota bacterium]
MLRANLNGLWLKSPARRYGLLATAAGAFLLSTASAHAGDEGDIGLQFNGNGELTTSLITDTGFEAERLFFAELGAFEREGESGEPFTEDQVFQDSGVFNSQSQSDSDTRPFLTNTPGFDTPEGEFEPDSTVTFSVVGNDLLVYDPVTDAYVSSTTTGGPNTGTVAEYLAASFNTLGSDTNPGASDSTATPGSQVILPELTTFSNGRYHRHYIFGLFPVDDPDSTTPETLAEDGVYLLLLDATATAAGATEATTSETFGIIFALGFEEGDELFEFAEIAAEALVPEPTTAGLLAGLGALAILRRRRRG